MPRRANFVGELVYHVVNRAATRMRLFDSPQDYIAAQQLLFEVTAETGMRLLAYCIMPNHWHLILWPRNSTEMSRFLQLFTGTHAQRWRAFHSSIGCGAVYQGRYKAFPIQTGVYFLNACRYVERNPVRAKLVRRAQDWQWSSCWSRQYEQTKDLTYQWPVSRPDDWLSIVNKAESVEDLQELRYAVSRELPLGDKKWVAETAKTLRIESRLRKPGRPKTVPGKTPPDPFF